MSLIHKVKSPASYFSFFKKTVAILLTVYLILCAIISVFVSHFAITLLPEQLSSLLGRDVSISAINVNPFTFEAEINQLNILEPNKVDSLVDIDTLYLDLAPWLSLQSLSVVVKEARIDSPTLNVRRLAQTTNQTVSFNFSDIMTTLSLSASEVVDQEPVVLPPIIIEQFSINNGTFDYIDEVNNVSIKYPNIKLSVANVNSALAAISDNDNVANKYQLHLEDKFKGALSLQGQFQLNPIKVKGNIDLAKIDLAEYWQFIDDLFDINLSRGLLTASSLYSVSIANKPDAAPVFTVSNAKIVLEKLSATHQQDEKINIDVLALNNISVKSKSQQIVINELFTETAKIKLNISPTGADLVTLLMPKPESPQVDAQDPSIQNNAIDSTNNIDINDLVDVTDVKITSEVTDVANTTNLNEATQAVKPNHELETQTKTENEPQWRVTVNKVNIKQYQVDLGESVASDQLNIWQLGPIDLTTKAIHSDLATPIDFTLSTGINTRSLLKAQGTVDIAKQAITADIDLSDIHIPRLQPYVEQFMNITLNDGVFYTKGTLTADANETLEYEGSAGLEQLDITDNLLKQPLLSWQNLSVDKLHFSKQQNSLNIDNIDINELFSRLIISEDKSNNVANLLKQPAPESTQTKSKADKQNTAAVADIKVTSEPNAKEQIIIDTVATPKFTLAISKINVMNSSTFFADNSLSPNFGAGIEALNGHITNLSSQAESIATVELIGSIDKYAPVKLKGEMNPLLEQPYLDLNLKFDKVELTSVNPYSGTYAGYYIDKGQISLDLNYTLKNNNLIGSNHVVINQLQLGKRSKSDDATSLPISLVVALLQDRHGVIDLGLDVSGNLDSPNFSFGDIIFGAIGNMITKTVTSPFTFLSGLFGGGETLDKVNFEYGTLSLSNDQRASLDRLAKALIDRPLLSLNIKGSIDSVNDRQAIFSAKLNKKLAKAAAISNDDLPDSLTASNFPTSGVLADALYVVYEQELAANPNDVKSTILEEFPELTPSELTTRWHIALYNMLKNNQKIGKNELSLLAQNRAKAVKRYLIESAGVDSGRIFIMESRINTASNAAEAQLALVSQ